MADVFEDKLNRSHNDLQNTFANAWTCRGSPLPRLRCLQKAMDCLKPGDVAIFATPPAFRWVNFTYAIEKG